MIRETPMTSLMLYKQQVVDTCRTLLDRGYLKATEGNISVRIPSATTNGRPCFAITPSSYDYRLMQAGDICILDAALSSIEGSRKPSIESGMHAAVYQSRPDVNAIIHTHQPYASTLALIGESIPALFDEQVMLLGRKVEIVPYGLSGTSSLAEAVRGTVTSGNNAYILKNHGALIFGFDPARAIHNMALLEKCAFTYLLALLTEKKITKIPPGAREIAFAKLRADEKRFAEQNKDWHTP